VLVGCVGMALWKHVLLGTPCVDEGSRDLVHEVVGERVLPVRGALRAVRFCRSAAVAN
jgi:hypothetical protein